ncbi:hypothetical protein FGO68_gene15896 [Halteria grandinella]|uniref:Palmitoyltransferase n=1 Tax=Halteria grandinella TaxID=5974 RepID=A0A8J8NAE3_HALGN|nr:hypothetical protein FGO68_gene15896 [Halteria grandinella]
MTTNIIALLTGILQNPGIPQPIIDKILKKQFGKGKDAQSEDIESQQLQAKQQQNPYGQIGYCSMCDHHKKDRNTYHCIDCDICIEGFDHHCVFFSKCIGGGNIISFWTSIIMVFAIFVSFGGLVVFDAVLK